MNEKESLIKLIDDACKTVDLHSKIRCNEQVAEYLLDNGVIVLSCKSKPLSKDKNILEKAIKHLNERLRYACIGGSTAIDTEIARNVLEILKNEKERDSE